MLSNEPTAKLRAFLARSARTPFAWGRADCSLFAADWAVALGHPDPAEHLRGRYSTALGCARLLKQLGGLEAVFADCAARAHGTPVSEPLAGAVGLVWSVTGRGPALVGAICTGPRWIARSPRGLTAGPATVVSAWRI